MVNPIFTARNVKWLPGHSGENFDFAAAAIEFGRLTIPALVYYPRPETKLHVKPSPDTMIELLAPFVAGLQYGALGRLYIVPDQVHVCRLSADAEVPEAREAGAR